MNEQTITGRSYMALKLREERVVTGKRRMIGRARRAMIERVMEQVMEQVKRRPWPIN